MFLLRFNCNFRPIKKDGWADNCTFLLGKDNLNGMFVYVRIKQHLPLVCPVRDETKSVHCEAMRERNRILGNESVDEIYGYKNREKLYRFLFF